MKKTEIEQGQQYENKSGRVRREVLEIVHVVDDKDRVQEATWLRGHVVRYKQMTPPFQGQTAACLLQSFASWAAQKVKA